MYQNNFNPVELQSLYSKPTSVLDYHLINEFFAYQRLISLKKPVINNSTMAGTAGGASSAGAADITTALDNFRMAVTNLSTASTEIAEAREALKRAIKEFLGEDAAQEVILKVEQQCHGRRNSKKGSLSSNGLGRFPVLGLFSTSMDEITPGLFVGSYHPANDLDLLKRNGITHICCCINVPGRFPGDFKYIIIPADDSIGYNIKQYFDQTFNFIDDAITSGGAVLVHCGAGISRATTVTIAYLIRKLRIPMANALSMVQSARTCTSPNPGFRKQLQEYEKEILGK